MATILDPIKLGPYELKNRVFLAPMTRNRANQAAEIQPITAEYYRQRATAGLIITEATQISQQGQGYPFTPGIYTDAHVAAWKQVTDAVHAAGSRIFLQLWHVGRVSHSSFQPGNALPVAPSAIGIPGQLYTYGGQKDYETPRALETNEIPGIIEQFVHGAKQALAAGFDGVEVHGANGYLLDQFLRDGSNKRTDNYGGSLENRARLLLEVTEAVIKVWGKERVGVRLSPANRFNGMSDSNPLETGRYVAEQLGKLGIAYLHVIDPASAEHMMGNPDSTNLSATYRPAFGSNGVYIINGGYDHTSGNAALAEGRADAVAYGIPFLANPDLPARFAASAELNAPDFNTFYQGGEKGYTDYPVLKAAVSA